MACKLDKQLFTDVSRELFFKTLAKSLGNYVLGRVITVKLHMQLYLNCSARRIFFFEYLEELRNIFLKEHLRKAALAAFLQRV